MTDSERNRLAHLAGLISADHPQLWREQDLCRAADRAVRANRMPAHGPRRPTVAEVRECYPLFAAHGWYLTPLLRVAVR